MTRVVLYSPQALLTIGLEAAMQELDGFALSAVSSISLLMEKLQTEPPNVILVEVTPDVGLTTLSELRSFSAAHVVLWVDAISPEFVSQALGLGVRGVLRKNLPIDLQLSCLQRVAAGELWLEKSLTDELLSAKRIVLTARQRQLVMLLVKGMSNKEIAQQLGITVGTVKVYLYRLFQKVDAKGRFELALLALKNLSAIQPSDSQAFAPAPHATEDKPWAFLLPTFVTSDRSQGIAQTSPLRMEERKISGGDRDAVFSRADTGRKNRPAFEAAFRHDHLKELDALYRERANLTRAINSLEKLSAFARHETSAAIPFDRNPRRLNPAIEKTGVGRLAAGS